MLNDIKPFVCRTLRSVFPDCNQIFQLNADSPARPMDWRVESILTSAGSRLQRDASCGTLSKFVSASRIVALGSP